ncbi:MAG: MFS transporter [Proteobacteria bacterium]|nr:MFS transporter [Pseudomonadota bacterium]
MTAKATAQELTSLRTKLFYGFGSVAYGVKDNGFQTILLPFYNLVLHLPPQWVGAAIAIALFFDAFIDPIIGHISDNLNTRWGRRHPLMYLAALPVSISYLLLWNPPHWSKEWLFGYLIVVAIIVRTFITFYEIPSSALVPELTEKYDERTSFLSYRVFFAWYGGLGMSVLAFIIFLTKDATHKVGQLNEAGYSRYGLTAAIVMLCAILISAWGTHKFIPFFRKPETRQMTLGQYALEMIKTLTNRAFLVLFIAALFFSLATGLVFALTFYINTYFWLLPSSTLGVLTLATFIAVFFSFVIAVPLSKRFGKKESAIGMFALGAAISVLPLVLGLMGVLSPGASYLVPLLFVFAAVGGSLTIGSSIMIVSMIADVVEDSELRTGRRSEGLFFAGNSFIQKSASGLGLFGSGLVLWVVGFPVDAKPGAVDPAIVHNFALTYLVIVLVLYGIGFLILGQFPISRASHEENVRRLAGEVAVAGEGPPAPTV